MTNDERMEMVEQIHLGPGFHEADRAAVVSALAALGRHLEHWRAESVDVHLSVKDRERNEQRVTLEVRLPRQHSLVVHVSDSSLEHTLVEARKQMIRQIEEVRGDIAAPTKNTHRDDVDGK